MKKVILALIMLSFSHAFGAEKQNKPIDYNQLAKEYEKNPLPEDIRLKELVNAPKEIQDYVQKLADTYLSKTKITVKVNDEKKILQMYANSDSNGFNYIIIPASMALFWKDVINNEKGLEIESFDKKKKIKQPDLKKLFRQFILHELGHIKGNDLYYKHCAKITLGELVGGITKKMSEIFLTIFELHCLKPKRLNKNETKMKQIIIEKTGAIIPEKLYQAFCILQETIADSFAASCAEDINELEVAIHKLEQNDTGFGWMNTLFNKKYDHPPNTHRINIYKEEIQRRQK